ncbi:MAG: GNAT family N-acetyltransferase [Jatrophihabitans sp.]
MLELARGLTPVAISALAELEARTLAADGGRLKLEWGVLHARTGRDVEDLLWWDGDRLLGYAGLYAFGLPTVELAGMVDPAARRRGIATALLDAALPICHDRGYRQVLLVTPRASVGGQTLASGRGAVLEHSEHGLVLVGPPTDGPSDPRISLRPATVADLDELARLFAAAFGWAHPDLAQRLAAESGDSERTLMIERAGTTVGTVRLTREGTVGGVYGFAVDPAWQGRGIGRDVLRQVCRQLRAAGADRVGLEVSVDNERALGLYTSIGFSLASTEDYYALAN